MGERNEDVGVLIVKCGQRGVRVSWLRLCRSVAVEGEKEAGNNLKHGIRVKRNERQGTRHQETNHETRTTNRPRDGLYTRFFVQRRDVVY